MTGSLTCVELMPVAAGVVVGHTPPFHTPLMGESQHLTPESPGGIGIGHGVPQLQLRLEIFGEGNPEVGRCPHQRCAIGFRIRGQRPEVAHVRHPDSPHFERGREPLPYEPASQGSPHGEHYPGCRNETLLVRVSTVGSWSQYAVRSMTPHLTDISLLSEEELEELQLDPDGGEIVRHPGAERWWIGSIIATALILLLVGLIGMAKGAADTRRAIKSGERVSEHVMGGH